MDTPDSSLDPAGQALARMGQDEKARLQMVSVLRDIEPGLTRLDFDARLEIIAPVLDALHQEVDVLHKKVQISPDLPVLDFTYTYRSQIARGLVLSQPEISDHVWEPQTTRLLLHLVHDASTVAIGGAYFGDHALLAGQVLDNSKSRDIGQIHCFEMNAAQLNLCRINAEKNNITNLYLHHKALYSRPGIFLHLSGEDAAACARPVPPEAEDAVEATSLLQVAREWDVPGFDLVMLDIEGGELDALKGGEEFLAQAPGRAPDLIFEVHRHYVDWSQGLENTDIVRLVRSYGYHVFALRDYQSNIDMRGYPIELIPPETCYVQGPPHGFNMVAVKDLSRLQGPQFRVVDHVSPKLLFHRDPALHAPGKA